MAKKKIEADMSKKKKKKKSTKKFLSASNAISMKSKKDNSSSNSNPFETIWSRRKFDILGKKRKGEERRIGLARSLSIQKARFFSCSLALPLGTIYIFSFLCLFIR